MTGDLFVIYNEGKRAMSLNWLHISDTHIKDADFDRDTVIGNFLKDIQRRATIDSSLSKIDLVFFTGDLVFSGQEQEYETAYRELLLPLAQELDIDISRQMFLVPGNHDVDHKRIRKAHTAFRQILNQQNKREEIRDLLLDKQEHGLLLEPQLAYFEFFNDTFDKIELLPPCNHYVRKVPIKDLGCVVVLGFNSAWLACGGDDDRGKIFLGEPQVARALDLCSESDFVISLLHHPFDWFSPDNEDTDYSKSRLIEKSRIVLHGHLHTPDFIRTSSFSGNTIFIPAGALFTTRNAPLSYNYVKLDLDSGEGIIYFRRYSSQRREWVKDVEATGDTANGLINFSTLPLRPATSSFSTNSTNIYATILAPEDDDEGLLDLTVNMMDAGEKMTQLMQRIGMSELTPMC